MFITVEGIEGSGKSTVVALLAEWLRSSGFEVVSTREPGGTEIAEAIRKTLLTRQHKEMTPETELLLYEAARAQHVRELIRPALESGKTVLCDRFADATLAYQGYGRGLDLEQLRRLNQWAAGGLEPDLTVLLDLDPETGLARARSVSQQSGSGPDRLESEDVEFHKRVRKGYLAIAMQEPERVKVIAVRGNVQATFEEVKKAIAKKLGSE